MAFNTFFKTWAHVTCVMFRVSLKSHHCEEIVWNLLKMLACLHCLWRFLGKWHRYGNILCQDIELVIWRLQSRTEILIHLPRRLPISPPLCGTVRNIFRESGGQCPRKDCVCYTQILDPHPRNLVSPLWSPMSSLLSWGSVLRPHP